MPTTSATSQSRSQSGSSSISIPQTAAAGGVTITQPPQTATSYFKIAQNNLVTFGWNMTSVLVEPTSLTVSAQCDNGNTYPVGPTDGIIEGDATQVVWDVYSWQQSHSNNPLPQGTCTLMICDERGYGASRLGGYMNPNSQLTFAFYTPQAYTPISSGWECTVCDHGFAAYASNPTFVTLSATVLVVFLSGFQLLRNAARAV
ncbi:hypothetical protein CYLTODRAFT_412060 [Cylindrobasidium torrendii FP15055 ss-10]|uniref:DUF7137 domain-containing protein n=1 Tax=Cylindrobasidium torrendii FP15055 ss-10 TaxID=1314674 RepID=A0A0D7B6J7_9AGAR|nr:hypothetical protein CYLTODRAFT_412060 [Cylindrobasidium torrendii FP15055 ss-10]